MQQEQINGLLRAMLVLIGSYLFGHNIFGSVIDASVWQEITGAIMVGSSFIWSIISRTLTLEIVQSSLLKVVMVAGSLLVTSGKITGELLTAFVGVFTAAVPIIYSYLSKKKSAALLSGTITKHQLK